MLSKSGPWLINNNICARNIRLVKCEKSTKVNGKLAMPNGSSVIFMCFKRHTCIDDDTFNNFGDDLQALDAVDQLFLCGLGRFPHKLSVSCAKGLLAHFGDS